MDLIPPTVDHIHDSTTTMMICLLPRLKSSVLYLHPLNQILDLHKLRKALTLNELGMISFIIPAAEKHELLIAFSINAPSTTK